MFRSFLYIAILAIFAGPVFMSSAHAQASNALAPALNELALTEDEIITANVRRELLGFAISTWAGNLRNDHAAVMSALYPERIDDLSPAARQLVVNSMWSHPLPVNRHHFIARDARNAVLRDIQAFRLIQLLWLRVDLVSQITAADPDLESLQDPTQRDIVFPSKQDVAFHESLRPSDPRKELLKRELERARTAFGVYVHGLTRQEDQFQNLLGARLTERYLSERARLLSLETMLADIDARMKIIKHIQKHRDVWLELAENYEEDMSEAEVAALIRDFFPGNKHPLTGNTLSAKAQPCGDNPLIVADVAAILRLMFASSEELAAARTRIELRDARHMALMLTPDPLLAEDDSNTPEVIQDYSRFTEALPYYETASALEALEAQMLRQPDSVISSHELDFLVPRDDHALEAARLFAFPHLGRYDTFDSRDGQAGFDDAVQTRLAKLEGMRLELLRSYSLVDMPAWKNREKGSAVDDFDNYIEALKESLAIIEDEEDYIANVWIPNRSSSALVRYTQARMQAMLWQDLELGVNRHHKIHVQAAINLLQEYTSYSAELAEERQARFVWSSGFGMGLGLVGTALLFVPSGGSSTLLMVGTAAAEAGTIVSIVGGVDELRVLLIDSTEMHRLSHDNPFGASSITRDHYERLQDQIAMASVFLGIDVISLGISAGSFIGNASRVAGETGPVVRRLVPKLVRDTLEKTTASYRELILKIRRAHPRTRGQLVAEIAALKSQVRELREIAFSDKLSGVFNRTAFELKATQVVQDAIDHGEDLGMIMIDGDFFKSFNDILGHSVGDKMISIYGSITKRVASSMRESDWVFRLGGEEFVILLPGTARDGVETVARRLREEVRASIGALSDSDIGNYVNGHNGIRGLFERIKQGEILDGLTQETFETAFRSSSLESLPDTIGTLSIGGIVRRSGETLEEMLIRVDKDNLYRAKQFRDSIVIEQGDLL